MHAERLILETNPSGKIKNIPKLPANKKIEAIFLVLDDVTPQQEKRIPHPDIAHKAIIRGDLFETVPAQDWDFSQ